MMKGQVQRIKNEGEEWIQGESEKTGYKYIVVWVFFFFEL